MLVSEIRGIAAGLALMLVATACASQVGVRTANPREIQRYLTRSALTDDHASDFTQTAWGADAEYSRGYYLLRAEAIVSRWTLPAVRAPFIDGPVRATSVSVEGRYKILPGLYAAARVDHLGFSTITGTAGPRTWDAPVDRLETGAGYYVQRNVLLKGSYQFDRRDTNRVPRSHLAGAEVVFWF